MGRVARKETTVIIKEFISVRYRICKKAEWPKSYPVLVEGRDTLDNVMGITETKAHDLRGEDIVAYISFDSKSKWNPQWYKLMEVWVGKEDEVPEAEQEKREIRAEWNERLRERREYE